MRARDNLQERKPRCHYNYRGKTKLTFETEKEALAYIKKMKLVNYTVYVCKVCNKYHIGHLSK